MENNDNNIVQKDFELDRIAFYGRTLLEYLLFFNLTYEDLGKYNKIMDYPSGASSFVTEVNNNIKLFKNNVISCDPLFDRNLEYLKRKGLEDIRYVLEKVKSAHHLYNWSFYKSLEDLKNLRMLALTQFALDYSQGKIEKRYIKAELPNLPFDDKSFDLVLSGHFLFAYANTLDFKFHKDSILELYRISAKEVRIYPIQQRRSHPYSHMKKLVSVLKEQDIKYDIVQVPFEFQKGSNKMLRLLRY
jgi:hypothetical protein